MSLNPAEGQKYFSALTGVVDLLYLSIYASTSPLNVFYTCNNCDTYMFQCFSVETISKILS